MSFDALRRRIRARLEPLLLSDRAFLERAYREILGRDADQDGFDYFSAQLRNGATRLDVVLSLARSEEHLARHAKPAAPTLPSLVALRPDRFRREHDTQSGQAVQVFEARGPQDFDWLEQQVLQNGYYEQPGVWNLGVDVDKRVMAEMVAALGATRALELGCAAGAVLQCLQEIGVPAEGVEISERARAQAPEAVRARIHAGDLLDLPLTQVYDVVFGLDVFEHLNPNRLGLYLAKLASLVTPGGLMLVNVPALGPDPVFGTVFPLYLDAWSSAAERGGPFSTLHADEDGYPLHGHLVWAPSAWWVARFEAGGLRRETDLERALHERYDDYFDRRSKARKAFYVFSRAAAPASVQQQAARIRAGRSEVLAR